MQQLLHFFFYFSQIIFKQIPILLFSSCILYLLNIHTFLPTGLPLSCPTSLGGVIKYILTFSQLSCPCSRLFKSGFKVHILNLAVKVFTFFSSRTVSCLPFFSSYTTDQLKSQVGFLIETVVTDSPVSFPVALILTCSLSPVFPVCRSWPHLLGKDTS